jgi:hypothetical protein
MSAGCKVPSYIFSGNNATSGNGLNVDHDDDHDDDYGGDSQSSGVC